MKTITVNEFMKFNNLCYSEQEIREIAGDKQDWSALDILRLESVSAEDKLWAVLRTEFLDDRTLRLFACWCARQANPTDPRSIQAIEVAERYANGEATEKELYDAKSAATTDAVWAAAWSAVARAAAKQTQVNHLIQMLKEQQGEKP